MLVGRSYKRATLFPSTIPPEKQNIQRRPPEKRGNNDTISRGKNNNEGVRYNFHCPPYQAIYRTELDQVT